MTLPSSSWMRTVSGSRRRTLRPFRWFDRQRLRPQIPRSAARRASSWMRAYRNLLASCFAHRRHLDDVEAIDRALVRQVDDAFGHQLLWVRRYREIPDHLSREQVAHGPHEARPGRQAG